MEIIIGKNAGFCFGVQNAVSKTEEKLKENKEIYCLGELVHNGEVIKKLQKMGLKIIDNIEQVGKDNKVIIRAHGISKETYKRAKELNIEILDYTCPSVLTIHQLAEKYAQKGYFILLIGSKKHPESLGTISFCEQNSYLLENEEEIEIAKQKIEQSNIKNVLIIAQTTYSMEKFNNIVERLKHDIDKDINIEIKNTICNATKIRQEETRQIAKGVDCMIIIGGKNSSNTKKLFEIAKENCKNTYIVESVNELNVEDVLLFSKIGIMAGASTPKESIEEIYNIISKR